MGEKSGSELWKYCAIGNIAKERIDETGQRWNGTPAFPGGRKVYLQGKYWDPKQEFITVIGLSRGRRYQVIDVPVELISNVRLSRTYRWNILEIMDNWEFFDRWWGNTPKDREEVQAFVEKWNRFFGLGA